MTDQAKQIRDLQRYAVTLEATLAQTKLVVLDLQEKLEALEAKQSETETEE